MLERKKKKMVNSKYAKAYTEVLEIISYFPQEAYNKIPSEKINFYKQNMDKNYKNISFIQGLHRKECLELLQKFFTEKRNK